MHDDPTETGENPVSLALDPANVAPNRIARWAGEDPDRPFLVEADSGRSVSYGEADRLVGRWARFLHDRGIGPGDRVASFLPSSIDAQALWLAASRVGALEVPINPELRGEFLRHVLVDAGVRLCLVRPGLEAVVGAVGVDGLEIVTVPLDAPPVEHLEPLEAEHDVSPDDVSCVIYTSGTTGPSKGVVITWAQMTANIGRIPREWLSGDDAVYAPWPMFHVTGRSPLVSMVDVGGRVVTRERFSLADFWDDVRAHGCTSTTVGAVTDLLLARPPRPDDADNPLRIVLFGRAGRSGVSFLERFDCRGMSFYGSTEVGFPIINPEITEASCDAVGWPRKGYRVRVVDPAGGGAVSAPEVAAGEVGELWVRPPDRRLILREYLAQPARTAEAVVDGWYRTGDAVRAQADGSVVFVDRLKDTIRRFGENISASALAVEIASDPEVLECAVVGVPWPVTGQEIHLLAVPAEGVELDPGALWPRLAARLPRYMRPGFVSVVDDLPKTPNGKIRRVDLSALGVDGAWRAPIVDGSGPA